MNALEPTRTRSKGTQVTKAEDVDALVDAIRTVADSKAYAKVNGTMVDLFSASAIISVYDALNESNRAKYAAIGLKRGIGAMASIAFSLLK